MKNKVFIAFFVIFKGKMAAILEFLIFFQIFKKQLLNIQLYDIIAKYELSNSISEVIGAKKKRFFHKNTKKCLRKIGKSPLTQKLGQNSKIEKISPLEKNSKIIYAKYRSSNIKTVPWAQKVNFRQKKYKES